MFQETGGIKKPRVRGEKYAQGPKDDFVLDRKSGKIIPQFSSWKSSRDVILLFFDENEKSILDERVCGICSGSGC